ncbi:PHP domain-containing protein [bacterium]|nr:PHP domain-containing protein [bacterium]
MKNKCADLHIHTIASDGTFSPRRVVQEAAKKGIHAIAITDHDTVQGIPEAIKAGRDMNIEVIPGVELAADERGSEAHILGLFIDWENKTLQDALKNLSVQRVSRMKKMIFKLAQFGMNIKFEEVLELAKGEVIGRLHLAQVMKKKGYVEYIAEAFNKYIGDRKACYVSRYKLSSEETISLIHRAGGVSIIAHPMLLHNDDIIIDLIKKGLCGIEAFYNHQPKKITEHYEKLAKDYGLLVTGGSDCHGEGKDRILIGSVKIPYEYVERLKKYRESVSGKNIHC